MMDLNINDWILATICTQEKRADIYIVSTLTLYFSEIKF